MAKGNIRSMRFSDEILEMIESQAGNTFTAKFEALVTRCMWELPQKERELAEIKKQIENERKNLRYIREKKRVLEQNLNNLEYSSQSLVNQINRCVKALEGL